MAGVDGASGFISGGSGSGWSVPGGVGSSVSVSCTGAFCALAGLAAASTSARMRAAARISPSLFRARSCVAPIEIVQFALRSLAHFALCAVTRRGNLQVDVLYLYYLRADLDERFPILGSHGFLSFRRRRRAKPHANARWRHLSLPVVRWTTA